MIKYIMCAGLLFLLITNCTSEPEIIKFREATPQTVQERVFMDVDIADSLNLTSTLGRNYMFIRFGLSPDFLPVVGLSWGDKRSYIYLIDKTTLESKRLSFAEGRGPGEFVRSGDPIFYGDYLYIADTSLLKVAAFDLNGQLVKEYPIEKRPDNFAVIDTAVFVTKSFGGGNYIFNVHDFSGNATSGLASGFEAADPKQNLLAYSGRMQAVGDYMYFGGYPEPLIKKYDLKTGDLLYSMHLIDDYPSDINYVSSVGDSEFMAYMYTEHALFATIGMAVDENFIYSSRRADEFNDHSIVDIYSAKDGAYLNSFKMLGYPISNGLVIDGNVLYSLEAYENESISKLIKYQVR